ncbi:DUF2948 family protein [Nitratireductor indicus]|uniref:DUF2948 family protein n=1 Tax=Nitratireductor indicus C115 TaxID=1231190 RepID=K2NN81_9HYPH|nr:DUF2948 family protein [Nitratireductor indicus]EKF40880.1 hypothetical protein NA8A_18352 [Nitratireductor indicus C115]MDS1138622.1 DUF2948 family protein [Nitratireductor indicus]SFQ33231.1 Protein of unknown function [Nitratireductor indicus]
MEFLKLVALDEVDLGILSAHLQDAVAKVSDLSFERSEKRFAVAFNRFVWEKEVRRTAFRRSPHERRRAILHFDRVLTVRAIGIDRNRPNDVLSLLAINFIAGEAPSGTIELIFSGDTAIRLEVECIEARLTDLGAAWETASRPAHDL